MKILIDCAATTSCVNSKFKKLGDFTPSNLEVKSFNGVKTCIEGYINARVNFGKFSLKANLAVIENLNFDLIFGMDHIQSLSLVKDSQTGQISQICLNGHYVNTNNFTENKFLCSSVELTIDAKSRHFINFTNPGFEKNSVISLISHPVAPKYLEFQPTLCLAKNIVGIIDNPTEAPIVVPKNVPLFSTLKEDPAINNLVTVDNPEAENLRHEKFLEARKAKFKPHLLKPSVKIGEGISGNAHQISEIDAILEKYNLAFSADKFDLGLIKGYRYGVDLKEGAEAWYQPPRKIPPNVRNELTDQFEQELENDLLCPGNSAYNIPMVIIKKKDGRFRCCLDMRQGNSRIVSSKYPLPDLGSILSEIGETITKPKN